MKSLLLLVLVCATTIAAAADAPKLPIFDYAPRYRCIYLGDTRMIVDTVKGVIRTAIRASHGLERWRCYDLRLMAAERDDDEATIPKSPRPIHGRFILAGTGAGGNTMFLDTLTGIAWTCQHSEGRLDLWKRYNIEEEAVVEEEDD